MIATAVDVPVGTRCSRLSHVHACWVKSGPVVQGRTALRMPFAEPVVVTPWNDETHAPCGHALLASGRDISEEGIAFQHRQSLPCRFAAVSFRGDDALDAKEPRVETVLVRLVWCRFVRPGRYLSGGRFDRMLAADVGAPFAPLLYRNPRCT